MLGNGRRASRAAAQTLCTGTASFQITDWELLGKLQRSFGIHFKGFMLDGAGGVAVIQFMNEASSFLLLSWSNC